MNNGECAEAKKNLKQHLEYMSIGSHIGECAEILHEDLLLSIVVLLSPRGMPMLWYVSEGPCNGAPLEVSSLGISRKRYTIDLRT